MFTFLELGNGGHRKGNIYNTLAISAIILLLVRPNALFEVGFQLSYAAVAGIVYFQPKITSLITPKNWILNAIWGLFTVSVAAQLSTTPLSLYYFHQFPIYFWVTNLIVVPISGLILYLSAVFFVLSFFPAIAGLVGIILNLTVTGLNFTVRTIESMPGSVIDQVWISGFTLVGLYLLMRATVPSLTNGSIRHFRLSILLTIALMVNSCLVYYRSSTQQKIIIYNLGQKNLISYLHGREHYYYSTKKEDLSIFEHNMVVNVSGKYHTSKPQWCDNLGILCPCIRYSNPYLILNGLVIEFASLPENSKKGPATDLRYDVKRGKVYYSALIHEKQVNKSFPETPSNDPNFAYLHDLKKDGAMIIDF
jgi:competence protein ComEC